MRYIIAAYVLISGLMVALFGVALVAACSQQQVAVTVTDIQAVCADIPVAEKADPAFVTHNPVLVADVAKVCGVAAVAQ